MLRFGLKSTFKSLVNVKSWVGWQGLSSNGRYVYGLYRALFSKPERSGVNETFEEAKEKYKYTDEYLQQQLANFEAASKFYLAVFFAGIIYMFWLYQKKQIMATIVMVPMNFMLFSFYFRESFWAMQIRNKKLGMTFGDWFKRIVLNDDKV